MKGFITKKDFQSMPFDGEMIDGNSLDSDFLNIGGDCGLPPACGAILPLRWTKSCQANLKAWNDCKLIAQKAKTDIVSNPLGGGSGAPPSPPPTDSTPTAGTPEATGMSLGAKIGIAVGILAVVGVGAYFIFRKK